MTQFIKQALKYMTLFFVGGVCYLMIEILYRGYSHPSMFLLGGLCFLLCGIINENFSWNMPVTVQMGICAIMITAMEFVFGVVLNIYLGLNVWDYSELPLNVMGQVCLPFTIAWYFLSVIAIVLDDMLRWKIFNEEKPRYTLF